MTRAQQWIVDACKWLEPRLPDGLSFRKGSSSHSNGRYIDGLGKGTYNGIAIVHNTRHATIILQKDLHIAKMDRDFLAELPHWRAGYRQFDLLTVRPDRDEFTPRVGKQILEAIRGVTN